MEMKIIARIKNDFTEKFGIPRQSGLAASVSKIVFEPEYRSEEALRGLDGYSHIWLIWYFSQAERKSWSPTVRPPRLGGNRRMGVFATRSPFRPNPVGLSSVRLIGTEHTKNEGTVLYVEGADLMNGTPILDIKPYLAYTDSHPEALHGFALADSSPILRVEFPPKLLEMIPSEKRDVLTEILSQDPRPQYQDDPERVYSMKYGSFDISFTVDKDVLTVTEIILIPH